MLLERVHFTNNTAGERGGGLVTGLDSHMAVMDSVVSGNSAPWGGGCNTMGVTYIERSTFDGNTASAFGGGGILNENWLVISDSAVTNNTAAHGAGIAGMGGGNLFIGNTTISGNSGGGLFNCEFCWAGIESSTIVDNSAPFTEHSGIMNWAELYLHNTIVAANTPYNCANPVGSLGFNLEDDDTCGFDRVGDQSNVDPMLGPLADNGGLTLTHALLEGSPAIDAADPLEFPATDQRGWDRPLDGDADSVWLPDIGSVEYAGVIFADGFEHGDTTLWSSSVP
jgi:hypothetical protein